jgi:hypothetical protein
MANIVYTINKGINAPIEFKGLKGTVYLVSGRGYCHPDDTFFGAVFYRYPLAGLRGDSWGGRKRSCYQDILDEQKNMENTDL